MVRAASLSLSAAQRKTLRMGVAMGKIRSYFAGMALAHLMLAAQGYIELGMPDEALRELDAVAPQDQNHVDVLQMRLFAFMRLRRWDDALAVCALLRREAPSGVNGYLHGAFCLHELGRTREAKQLLLDGPASLANEATYHYNLACYDAVLGNLEEACRHLEISFQMDKKFREIAQYDPDLRTVNDHLAS